MDHLHHILFVETHPRGCAGRGFSCALDLARSHGARLTVVGVAPGVPALEDGPPLTPGAAERRQAQIRRLRRRLADEAEGARSQGVPIVTRVLEGDAVQAVLGEVHRGRYDLVLKVAECRGPFWPWRLARDDRALLRTSPCPVSLLDPAQRPGVRSVLAAVDLARPSAVELNRRIVRLAASLADRAGADLHLVHVWSIPGETILSSPLRGLTAARLRRLRARTRRERMRSLEELVAREAPGAAATLALPKGDPVRAIRDEAHHVEADVVVVGHSGRSGVDAVLLGNVPERLVGRIPGSVLAVGRPSGGGRGAAGVVAEAWETGAADPRAVEA